MAKVNLGRVRYPIEATVKPGSCWPVSAAAVAKYVGEVSDTILATMERLGRLTYRNGWFIRYIDDTNWNYTDGTGTVQIYVCDEQQRLSTLVDSSASTSSVYDASFDTGWEGYASDAEGFGDLVVVKNLGCFVEAGILKAVKGNRITIQGVGNKFLNSALAANGVDHLKVFFTSEYQEIEGTGQAPGAEHPEYADEWSISLARPYATVAGETSIHNVGDLQVSQGGYSIGDDTAALGNYSFASGVSSLALAIASQSLGVGIYNPINGATIVGRWNKLPDPTDDYPFAVGIGTGENDRKDGFRVNSNGSVFIKSIADLPAPKRSDTLASLTIKMRNLAAALCRNPDGTAANGSASGGGDDDGDTQTLEFSPALSNTDTINDIAAGETLDGRKVAVAATTKGLYYTDDGVSFTQAVATGIWHGVVFDTVHKQFVAVSSTGVRWSSDGITWDPSRVRSSFGGGFIDSTAAEGEIRFQKVNDVGYVFVGSRASTDGGVTFGFSEYQDLAAVCSGFNAASQVFYAAIRGGKLCISQKDSDMWSDAGLGGGFIAIDSAVIHAGESDEYVLTAACTADGEVFASMSGGAFLAITAAPRDTYTGVKVLTDGKIAMFSQSNGIIMRDFDGTTPGWSKCYAAMSGQFNVPYDAITVNDVDINITTQFGLEDCLLVRRAVAGGCWTRATGFTFNCYPPVLYGAADSGELLAVATDGKKVLRIPMVDIGDAIRDASEKSAEEVPPGRFVDGLDGDVDGLSSVIEAFNKLAGKVNMILDRAAL